LELQEAFYRLNETSQELEKSTEKMDILTGPTKSDALAKNKIIMNESEKQYLLFLKKITEEFSNQLINIEKPKFYKKYELGFDEDLLIHKYSHIQFNRKLQECPCVIESRIKYKSTDPEYALLEDPRMKSWKIDTKVLLQWINQINVQSVFEKTKIVSDEKYFILFLSELIKDKKEEISIERVEFYKQYIKFMTDNDYTPCTDSKFHKQLIKTCPHIYDHIHTLHVDGKRTRPISRNFNPIVVAKWISRLNETE